MISSLFFWTLRRHDGESVSGGRRAVTADLVREPVQ
jgi:hypothetical protein